MYGEEGPTDKSVWNATGSLTLISEDKAENNEIDET
jgi:hypothetical protein